MERVGWMSSGWVGRAGARLTHGLEVWRERSDGPHWLVSFVNVAGWRAEMQLAHQGGRLVASALRVTPEQPDPDLRGSHAAVAPPGGITSRLLRHIPVHAHVQAIARMLSRPHEREQIESLVKGTELEELLNARPPTRSSATRRGRKPIATERLLEVAQAYDKAVKARSAQPVLDAATSLGLKVVRVRDLVHRARLRGLLTETPMGLGGGALTPAAQTLLKADRKKTQNVPANVPATTRQGTRSAPRQPTKKRKTPQ